MTGSLLRFRRNVFSQNGEDGILEVLFELIGLRERVCCEFGAHDGVTFSNTRRLVMEGWKAIMIEADPARFEKLKANYGAFPGVVCLNEIVDVAEHRLDRILDRAGLSELASHLSFLSVDIDGLDFEILESLTLRPCVLCIEVNAAHAPDANEPVPSEVAARNVGQPLAVMARIAIKKGYALVCFNSNAFFVRRDVLEASSIPVLTPELAYAEYLGMLSQRDREWLYLENLALVPPFHAFGNPYLTRQSLGMRTARAAWLRAWSVRFRAAAWYRAFRGHPVTWPSRPDPLRTPLSTHNPLAKSADSQAPGVDAGGSSAGRCDVDKLE
jgi:hypothetical protein